MHPLTRYRQQQRPPLSKAKLAERLNVSKASISRYESGNREIAVKLIGKFSERTGIPPEELRPDLASLFKEPGACA